MTFAQFASHRFHKRRMMIDPEFLDFHTSHYRNKSSEARETECCISIDVLVEMGVYTEKAKAKAFLLSHYTEKDYSIAQDYRSLALKNISDGSSQSEACSSKDGAKMSSGSSQGRPTETILLTPNTFRDMCIQVQNETGRKLRRYYLLLEDTIHEFMIYEREYSDSVSRLYLEDKREAQEELTLTREANSELKEEVEEQNQTIIGLQQDLKYQEDQRKMDLSKAIRKGISEAFYSILDERMDEQDRDMAGLKAEIRDVKRKMRCEDKD